MTAPAREHFRPTSRERPVNVIPDGEDDRHGGGGHCWCEPTLETWVLRGRETHRLMHTPLDPACGAQDWAHDDDGALILYGTCRKPAGHQSRWHQDRELPGGRLLAEWSGPADARAPAVEAGP